MSYPAPVHIVMKSCPHCEEAAISSISVSARHSNGQYNEEICFDCGLRLHYSPNFNRVVEVDPCEYTPAAAPRARRRWILDRLSRVNYSNLPLEVLEALSDVFDKESK